MPPLLVTLQEISKTFGSIPLFTHLSFSLHSKETVGLIGPNGAGKSTLLRILAGIDTQDEGLITKKQGIRIAYVPQLPSIKTGKTLDLLLNEILHVPHEEAYVRASTLLSKIGLTNCEAATLSGGWKKRLDIAKAFIAEPDLILLDEPTNHLDFAGIKWLESFLNSKQYDACSYLLISHDRYFLETMCDRIIEINTCFPSNNFSVHGGWIHFCEARHAFLSQQRRKEARLSALVETEQDWANRFPKARTTKSKSRLQRGELMKTSLSILHQQNRTPCMDITFSGSKRQTRHLLVATNIQKRLNDTLLFSHVNCKLSPGTRLGIIGNNGTGKTTLLRILAKEISPDLGTVKYADDLQTVYFDQHREVLDLNQTLKEALSPLGDFVHFRGEEIHVHGWAKKFLFSPERLALPLHVLSPGERIRILLANLMRKPADVLLLDEPTNDLDIATLEILEDGLKSFPGAVVLITHDRCLLDRVCTEVIGLGHGTEEHLFADYEQWERTIEKQEKKPTDSKPTSSSQRKKLSYLEQKELETMEETLLSLEQKAEELETECMNTTSSSLYKELHEAQQAIEMLYERWQNLLNKQNH